MFKKNGRDDTWNIKHYQCRAHCFDIKAGRQIVVLNEREALANDIYTNYRVLLRRGDREVVAVTDLSPKLVKSGEIGLFAEVAGDLGVNEGNIIEIKHLTRPTSLDAIKRKLDGKELSGDEIDTILDELMENKLSEAELAALITGLYIRGMTDNEVVSLTDAIVRSGQTLKLERHPIVDKHCTGGIAGNRTTMVVVPIIAAAGLTIPKTSSRSITSAAGTADTMEVLAPVDLPIEETTRVVKKTNGCIVWGGGMDLAAADDRLIKIRHPLALDPRGILLASILAKKKSVGAEFVVIDIPVGRGAKIEDAKEAEDLGSDFIKIGKRLNMGIEVLITDGSDPIGNGIGPILECKDVFSVLEGKEPADLRDKSCRLAGALLELCGKVEKGRGFDAALELLKNGKALKKFREIIEAQGGNPNVKGDDLQPGSHVHKMIAEKTGRVSHVDNRMLSRVARAAGAPMDKGAGIHLHCEQGDKVNAGDVLFEIYAESPSKLEFAVKTLKEWEVIELQKVVLGTMR